MANAVAVAAVRRLVSSTKSASSAKIGNRKFHSSGPKKMADHGHSDGSIYSNDYIHAPHMYDITGMKYKRLKMGLLVFGGVAFGTAVPVYATHYQMKKSAF